MTTGPILAIDTATSRAVVALGDPDGRLLAEDGWIAGRRHAEELLPRIDSLLHETGVAPSRLAALVVGTGPGAFTGLRVGLATAKTLAHQLGVPIAGVSTGEALLLAAQEEAASREAAWQAGVGAARALVLLLPAGSTDRLVVRAGQGAELLPGGREPELAAGEDLVAIDLDGRADPAAVRRGEAALTGLAAALARMGAQRLAAGDADDVARLVPEYVTLPRGVAVSAGEIAWSRDRH
jgi:tRNA threonylcarbamoyl adenosine modification protein YeaZ